MKKFKRLSAMVSVLLCLSMMFGMSTVFAEDVDSNNGNTYKTFDFATETWCETPMPEFDPTLNAIPPTGDLVTSPYDPAPFGFNTDWTPVTNTGAKPYKAIAQLKITYKDGTSATGSGFAVGSGKVLTAAHCIKNGNGSMATSMTLYFGRNAGVYMKQASGSKFTVNAKYGGTREYDYGILSVPSSVTDYTGTFGLYSGVYSSQVYTLTGYPNAGIHYNKNKMYTYSSTVDKIWDTVTSHSLYACGGMSGSPLYGSNNYAVAIHTGGYDTQIDNSVATNIDTDTINFVNNFKA